MSDTLPAPGRPEPTDEPRPPIIDDDGSTPSEPAHEATASDTSPRPTTDDGDRFRRAVAVGLAAYVVSRLCVLAGAGARAAQIVVDEREDGLQESTGLEVTTEVLTSWDGRWYLEIARNWYPESIPPNITYNQDEARAAFFPMYPGAVRVVDAVLPGGDTFAALFLNFVLGAISVVLVGLMARRVFSTAVAARSMTLYAIFPGSFVLSFAYSEALLIVFAASCLLLLYDEQWLLAGLAGALATATRPNGIALVVACVVAAAIAIHRKRAWSSLLSVLIAPVGFIGFQLYIDDQTGESGAWFRVQREAWEEGTSFGATAITNTWGFFTGPLDSPTNALTALTLVAMVGMLYTAWKRPLPLPWLAYCLVIILLMLVPETVTARPRFLFTAFPLFIAVAAWWPDPDGDTDHHRASWDRAGWDLTLVLCGAGLTALTVLYAVFGAIP